MDKDTLAVEWVELDRLHGNPANPRLNDSAVPHVAASIQRFGWRQPIVARPSGEVIAGNTRLKAAQSLGMTEVPVVRFEGSDIEATAFGIADNSPDFDQIVQNAVERVFKLLALPRRSDVEALNRNLERVAEAVESLGSPPSDGVDPAEDAEP